MIVSKEKSRLKNNPPILQNNNYLKMTDAPFAPARLFCFLRVCVCVFVEVALCALEGGERKKKQIRGVEKVAFNEV